MSRFACLIALCGLAFTAAPVFAEEPQPATKKASQTELVLDALAQEVKLQDNVRINEIPLFELLQDLSKRHQVTFTILEEHFRADGQPNIKEEKPKLATTMLRNLTVHQFLTQALESVNAMYLVKNGTLEIVPVRYAAKATRSKVSNDDGNLRLNEPLVSVIFKEKPLNEAVAQIAEMHDLNVVIAPQAGDARTGFVSARLLNVPADKALELLADQCDLRIVRRGAAFMLTSKDHANALFEERMDRKRQKIELEKLRTAPPKPPEPAPAPVPPPGAPVPPAPKM